MHAEHLEAVHGVGPHTTVFRVSNTQMILIRARLTMEFQMIFLQKSVPSSASPCLTPE